MTISGRLSYADVVRGTLSPTTKTCNPSEKPQLDSIIKEALSSPKGLAAFLERSLKEAITSLENRQLTPLPPSTEDCPLISKSFNHVSKTIRKASSFPLRLTLYDLRGWKKLPIPGRYYDAQSGKYHLPPYGCCYGLCVWTAILYLKTKHLFQDVAEHMHWLGQQNQEGANLPQILLHTLNRTGIKKGKKAGLIIGTQREKKAAPDPLDESLFRKEITQTLRRKLNELKPGVYLIENHCHACLYIKDNRDGYFFDPNEGIRQITGSQAIQLHHYMKNAMFFEQPNHTQLDEEALEKLIDQAYQHRTELLKAEKEPTHAQTKKSRELEQSTLRLCRKLERIFRKGTFSATSFIPLFSDLMSNEYKALKQARTGSTQRPDLLKLTEWIIYRLKSFSDYFITIYPIRLREPSTL